MQAFYTENFDFSEAGFIRINQIGTFSKHLFKKKSISFSRYKWNGFMGASLGVKNKKKKHTWKDDMVLLLKKRKNICFANKIHKRPAIVVNVSFQLGFFSLFFQLQTLLLPLSGSGLL
jgi:hypothetical protein